MFQIEGELGTGITNLSCAPGNPRRRLASCGAIVIAISLFAWGNSARCQSESSAVPAAAAQTQSAQGSVHGVVAGKDGELYEGVRVTLASSGADAPASRTQTTNSDGVFNFEAVPAGAFTLTLSSDGFTTQTLSGVVHAGESYDANTVVLTMARATDEVQVTASEQDIQVEQLREEVHQRVFGVIPNFYVSYVPNAAPLTARQKFSLAWKSSIDPMTWLGTGAVAGMEQAGNNFSGYGQGAQGYAKRYGASYSDQFIGNFLGGAVFPAMFKQDPRYFYKGTGSVRSRALYAIANSVICKGDNGHWQFDYSGILGSLAAGGVSNFYYPASDRDGPGLTFKETGFEIGGNAVANLFQEFVVRRLTPKLPRYPVE